MKKFFLLLASIVLGVTAGAQDTIYSTVPKSNYFVSNEMLARSSRLIGAGQYSINPQGGDLAISMYSEDTLTVYGLAGAIIPQDYFHWPNNHPEEIEDTSHAKLQEAMRLYAFDIANSTLNQLGEDLWVHVVETPISYYLQLDQLYGLNGSTPMPIFPVYERYFSVPQVVVDTFFVGYTQQCSENIYSVSSTIYAETNWTVGPVILANASYSDTGFWAKIAFQSRNSAGQFVWRITPKCFQQGDWFFYPILTPNPDTTSTGSDTTSGGGTLSAVEANPLARTVMIAPNPAAGQVRVTSGIGLSQVEVFDASGRRVLSTKASGLTCRFDVKRWTKGHYTVVVQTPKGRITKKFLVE